MITGIVSAGAAFSDSAGLMIISHISSIASVQANWEKGFLLIVLISSFNTLGRIMAGAIIFDATKSYLLSYIIASILLMVSLLIGFSIKDNRIK